MSKIPTGIERCSRLSIFFASRWAKGTPRRRMPMNTSLSISLVRSRISCAKRTRVRSTSEALINWAFSRVTGMAGNFLERNTWRSRLRVTTPDHLSADDRRYRTAPESLPVVRRVAAFRERLVHVIGPFACRGEHGHIRHRAHRQRTALDSQNASRTRGEQIHHPSQADLSGLHQLFEHNPYRRLEPDNAKGASLKLLHLLAARMRSVIGRDGVDRARGHARDHRRHIMRAP